jgi:hypothetical protein
MSEEQEQRMCFIFCVKLGKSGVETLKMLKTAYRENALTVHRFWVAQKVKKGRESTNDNPRPGHPSTSRNNDSVARVKQLVGENTTDNTRNHRRV